MKTRDEQIREAASKIGIDEGSDHAKTFFIKGAEWADSHPVPLTIPEGEIDSQAVNCWGPGLYRIAVDWALEYLNAQRGGKP